MRRNALRLLTPCNRLRYDLRAAISAIDREETGNAWMPGAIREGQGLGIGCKAL
jgi:hypothetical protein